MGEKHHRRLYYGGNLLWSAPHLTCTDSAKNTREVAFVLRIAKTEFNAGELPFFYQFLQTINKILNQIPDLFDYEG